MKQLGKFLLLDLKEFENWLSGLVVQRKIKVIQNHHTWIPDYTLFNKKLDNHFPLLQSMETSHRERGFDQIAQNITTFPDGLIAIGRPLDIIPAGIKGANSFGICIEHIGNFDAKDVMTAKHAKSILKVNALLCKKFKLAPNTDSIVYHHWYDLTTGKRVPHGSPNTKTCPGTAFFGGNTIEACVANFIPLVKAQ
jgi:hypothetical protein